jgi:hypothetical protein
VILCHLKTREAVLKVWSTIHSSFKDFTCDLRTTRLTFSTLNNAGEHLLNGAIELNREAILVPSGAILSEEKEAQTLWEGSGYAKFFADKRAQNLTWEVDNKSTHMP